MFRILLMAVVFIGVVAIFQEIWALVSKYILVDDLSMPKPKVELIEPVSHEEMASQIFSMDKMA